MTGSKFKSVGIKESANEPIEWHQVSFNSSENQNCIVKAYRRSCCYQKIDANCDTDPAGMIGSHKIILHSFGPEMCKTSEVAKSFEDATRVM